MEDRTHRSGQLSANVLYKDIIMRKTVDELVYSVIQSKRDLLEYMRAKSPGEFLGEV